MVLRIGSSLQENAAGSVAYKNGECTVESAVSMGFELRHGAEFFVAIVYQDHQLVLIDHVLKLVSSHWN
jgi:hypothetical protein